MKSGLKKQTGLTLISILIASSILVILTTYISMILFDMARFDLRSQSDQYITSNTRFIVTKLKQNIRKADSIISPEHNQQAEILGLKIEEETVSYYLEDGMLIQDDPSGKNPISSNLVKVDNFRVSLIEDQHSSLDLPTVEVDIDLIWLGKLGEDQKQNFEINTSVGIRK